jgi:hypothetical protein
MEFICLFPANNSAEREFLLKFEDDFIFEGFVVSEPGSDGLWNTT